MRPLTAISLLTIGSLLAVGAASPIHNTPPASSSASPDRQSHREPVTPPSSYLVPVSPPPSPSSSGSPVPQQTAVLDLKGVDDQLVAAKRTQAFLIALGYDAKFPTDDPTDGIWITDETFGLTVRVFSDSDGLDRLVISCALPGKGPGSLDNLAVLQGLNDINNRLNVGIFLLTPEGDLALGTNLVFDDTLSAKLFHQHIEHVKGFVAFFLTTKSPTIAKARGQLIK